MYLVEGRLGVETFIQQRPSQLYLLPRPIEDSSPKTILPTYFFLKKIPTFLKIRLIFLKVGQHFSKNHFYT
jgi:hypothetical protein